MSRPRVLVIGRNGQLALSLAERARDQNVALSIVGRPELDLTSASDIREAVAASSPDTIINAAAYTAVDKAEDEPELAHRINAVAPAILAEAARDCGARLIHVSTDYVFDGGGERAWTEDDGTGPVSVYGQTKLAGEEAIRERLDRHAIVRTAWVYSPFGSNFVKTMLSLARNRPELRVVGDQIGNPTSALDLADGLLTMVRSWREDPERGLGRTYHLAGTGSTSWAEFAREIFTASADRGGPSASVTAIPSAEWPAKAPRPLNSRLDSSRFERAFGYAPPPWRDSLVTVIDRLLPIDSGPSAQ